jgi:hypothetical protein
MYELSGNVIDGDGGCSDDYIACNEAAALATITGSTAMGMLKSSEIRCR